MSTLSEPTPDLLPGVVDAAPDALVVVDGAGALRFANARAEVFLGRSRQQLLGQSVEDFVPGVEAAVAELLHGQSGQQQRVELTAICPTGDAVPVEVWLTPIAGVEGLVAVAIRDDSERRSMREASARLRDELIASISHELRTPLTSIIGYTELLVDMGEAAVSGRAAELLEVIERNAERELRLVEDLLTLAAISSTGLTVERHPTDLAVVVDEVAATLSDHARQAGVELHCSHPGALWVRGDAVRLRQMITKLVTNAVKFTAAGGRVTVALSTDGTHGVLAVADQGIGVPASEVPLVFDDFFRGAEAVDRHLPGAGLGLPIVKGIVDAHDGQIDVASARDEGTTVEVRLPLAEG